MTTVRNAASIRRELSAARQIPYCAHVSRHVVKTKLGDFVQVFRLRGMSFESADDEELNTWHERLNVTWRNIASPHVALWFHIIRRRDRDVPVVVSTDGFAGELAAKYRRGLVDQTLMVNELYVSIVYRPIAGAAPHAFARVLSRNASEDRGDLVAALESCEKLAQTIEASLSHYEPERLSTYERSRRHYSRVLEFFGVLINGEGAAVPLPCAPLDEVLAITRPLFGTEVIEYRLPAGTRFGAVLGVKEYPTPTMVGMYNLLLAAPFPFVLTQSFTFLTKGTAQGLLLRQYHRMENAGDFAVSQAEELKDALDALTANEFAMGDHHLTLQVLTEPMSPGEDASVSLKQLNDHIAVARTLLADTGMTVAREDLALEAAFWAQLPGCFALRPRKAPITSRNLAAMVPLHNYPCGRATGNQWGAALALLITSARSPYFFNLHVHDRNDAESTAGKDVGHTLICGPTGSGKTVFMGFLMTLLAQRGVTQVIIDKDQGLEVLVRALGGRYFQIKNGEPTGFNPLQLEPTPDNIEFLRGWVRLLVRGSVPLSAREETDLDEALQGTMRLPRDERRLSRLVEVTDRTRSEGLHARLARWCHSTRGDYAYVFDNANDEIAKRLSASTTIGFDVTQFLKNDAVRGPVNRYLFHIVGQLLDGRPLVCWVDEFSNVLADPDFQSFADNAPKTWRKFNGVLCAATQNVDNVLKSPIARTLIEQTATKIYFPNPEASAADYIDGLGVTEREFKLIKEQLDVGSRRFLVKQGHSSIVCELNLRGFEAELAVISGRKGSVERMQRVIADTSDDPAVWVPRFMAAVQR